jgi:hypothetical protein
MSGHDLVGQMSFLSDTLEEYYHAINKLQVSQASSRSSKRLLDCLQKRTLFQGSEQICFLSYVLIDIIQAMALHCEFNCCLDHVTSLCNGLTRKMLSVILNEDREASESILVLSILTADLLTIQMYNSVEFPVAMLMLKSIVLQLIDSMQLEQKS